jgi:putative transposase
MDVRRTVPVKLTVSDDDAESLHATIDEFQQAANYVVSQARNDNGYVETSKQRLHERTYQDVRDQTDLHANLVQAARSLAADALESVVARWQDGQTASLPTFTADFLDYDKRSATFHDDHASLATVDGRIHADYILHDEDSRAATPHGAYLFADDYEIGGASLHYHDHEDTFYLHVRTKTDVDETDHAEHPTVLGVDLGIENVAVTSTATFWDGGYLNHRRDEYERVRGSLQQTGTESAHQTIKRIGQRESRWAEDYLHCVSAEIVEEAIEYECDVIVFEQLTGIRDRMPGAKTFHTWAFHRLYEYVEYKAEAEGIDVTQINPAYTSQRCSRCGYTARNNRTTQADFSCKQCGYQGHADYNAAKNIGLKHVRAGQKSPHGRATRQLALKSGTVSANGEFSPASDGQSGSSPASSGL